MNRYIIGSLWDRINRNGLNSNFEFLFDGVSRMNQLSVKADNTLKEAERINRINNDTNERLDNIIADSGTSSTEVVDARGGATVLGNRFNKIEAINNVQSLKSTTENTSDSSVLNLATKEEKRPLVTFVDDDGAESVYTRLRPIFNSRGVPCTIAVVSDWIGSDDAGSFGKALTQDQILELQALGWEVASHEKTHSPMYNVHDRETLEQEIAESKRALLSNGFDVKNIVYPYGQENATLRKMAKKFYKAGFKAHVAGNASLNDYGLNTFRIERVALGSYGNDEGLEYFKGLIDQAKAENKWLIFMTHVWAHGSAGDQLVADVIDYTQQSNIDIVNLDEGINTFGNRVEIDDFMALSANNEIISDFIIPTYKQDLNGATFTTPIEDFKEGGITYTQINHNGNEGFPDRGSGGMLITDRVSPNRGFQKQTFKTYNYNEEFERYWGTNREWSTFFKVPRTIQMTHEENVGTVPAGDSVDLEIPVDGASTADSVVVSATPPTRKGLITTADVIRSHTVLIRFHNYRNIALDTYNAVYNITVIKRN